MTTFHRFGYIWGDMTKTHSNAALTTRESYAELSNRGWLKLKGFKPVTLTEDDLRPTRLQLFAPVSNSPTYLDIDLYIKFAFSKLRPVEAIKLLNRKTIRHYLHEKQQDPTVFSLLQYAIAFGGTDWLKALLDNGVTLERKFPTSPVKTLCPYSAFHYALAIDPSPEKLQLLISHGADIDLPATFNPFAYVINDDTALNILFETGVKINHNELTQINSNILIESHRKWLAKNAQDSNQSATIKIIKPRL